MADLAVVIVNFNTKDLTIKCLKTIFQNKWQHNMEVWLVDNASSDGSVEAIKDQFPLVKVVESPKNVGFAAGNNLALNKITVKYVLLLNSDTEVKTGSIDKLVDFAENSGFDICSCKIIDQNGNFQPNAGELPRPLPLFWWISGLDDTIGRIIHLVSYQERYAKYYTDGKYVGWVSGTAMLIKQQVFEKIGLFDEKIFMYGEEVEFCLRAKGSGFKIGWTDEAEIKHLGGGSSRSPQFAQWAGEFKGLLYIYRKHYGLYSSVLLRLLFYFFITIRAVCFLFLGKLSYTKTYAKVFFNI